MNRAYVHSIGQSVTIALYGPNSNPRALALNHGAKNKVCLIKAPSTYKDIGYQQIVPIKFGSIDKEGFDVYGEGVVLTKSKSTAIIQTADCLTVTAFNSISNKAVVFHAGRAALSPVNQLGKEINNIVTIAYRRLIKGCSNPNVHIYMTGGICGGHFLHNHPSAKNIIRPFEQFGDIAFYDRGKGALNLTAIVKHQFKSLGVPSNNIKHDGLCTFEEKWLASYRRGKRCEERNCVVVTLH